MPVFQIEAQYVPHRVEVKIYCYVISTKVNQPIGTVEDPAAGFKKLIPNLNQLESLNVVLAAALDKNETNA